MNSANIVLLAGGIFIAVLLVVSILKKEKTEELRLLLFVGMIVPIVFVTLYLAIDTILENTTSATRGPVHWHADYKIFVCGKNQETQGGVKGVTKTLAHADEAVDLKDPKGISNRVGSSDFHEHGDNRIHVEGTIRDLADVSLKKFFATVGGELTPNMLRLPTNAGELIVKNGMPCPDDKAGTLQAFVYQTRNNIVTQEKLTNFPDYVLSPYGTIPPGDCLIFEFDSQIKDKTDNICPFYEIALNKGEVRRGY